MSKAYSMPKETGEQKAEKDRVTEAVLREACSVPLAIMQKCCEAIDLHQEFACKYAGTAGAAIIL